MRKRVIIRQVVVRGLDHHYSGLRREYVWEVAAQEVL